MEIIEKIKARIKEIFQKTPKKIKKGIAIGTLAATAAGTVASCSAEKDAQENFKDQIKYDVKKDEKQASEPNNVERANQSETVEEVDEFLKDIYIELYEKKTGDTTRTTEDIEFKGKTNQDYVYVNQETGEIITHGKTPSQVEQKLKEDGISYKIQHDVDIYRVMDKDGNELEGITLQSKDGETVPVKVFLGDQYDNKQDTSILAEMGMVIPCGLDYKDYLEKGNKNDIAVSKAKFVKAVEKFENEKVEQKAVEDEIKALKTPEEVLQYLKNMYIEQYEEMTGDKDLTTADIELDVYLKNLYKVENKSNQEYLSTTAEPNVKVYQVKNTKKNVIDCVSLESEDGKTVPFEVIMSTSIDSPIDNSVLATMGTAIPEGLNYVETMEQSNENDRVDSQRKFIKAVKEFQKTKDNRKIEKEGFEPGE